MASRPAWLPTAQPVPGGAAPAKAQQRHVFLPEGAGTAAQQWGAKPSPYQQWRKPAQEVQPEAPAVTQEPHGVHRPDGDHAAQGSSTQWEPGPGHQHAWQPDTALEPWHDPGPSRVASQPASPLHHIQASNGTVDPLPGTPNGAASPTLDAAVRLRSIHNEISALQVHPF